MSDAGQQTPTDTVEEPATLTNDSADAQQNDEAIQTPNGVSGDEYTARPSKRRRLTDSLTPQQRPSPRAVSPPWKKFQAEGPTTFLDQTGKRRSGRTNALPLELQPPSAKRRTRASVTGNGNVVSSRYSSTPVTRRSEREAASQTQSAPKHSRTASRASQTSTAKSPRRYSFHAKHDLAPATPIRSTRRKPSTSAKSPSTENSRLPQRQRRPSSRAFESEGWSTRPRRFSRHTAATRSESEQSEEVDSEGLVSSGVDDTEMDEIPVDPNQRTPRIKFKVNATTLGTPSWGNTAQFARETRKQWTKRDFSSLDEWLEWAIRQGHQVFPGYDVYEGDDEYLKDVIEDGETRRRHRDLSKQSRAPVVSLTVEGARKEARRRLEVEQALQPGGLLHKDNLTQQAPEKFEDEQQIRRQYAHWDHVVAHAARFRKLMLREQNLHREKARRLAYAAQEKWLAIQPKSQEEIDEERASNERAVVQATKEQCLRDLLAKFDLIRTELDGLRLAKWQEEQDALGKKALNKVMEQSAHLLEARRNRDTSELGSDSEDHNDEDGVNDSSGDSDGSSEDDGDDDDAGSSGQEAENMSSSGSESDDDDDGARENDIADEKLTVDELREKYAQAEVANQDRPPDDIDGLAVDEETARNTLANEAILDPDETTNQQPPDDIEVSDDPVEIDEDARQLYNEMAEESDESIDMSEEESSEDDKATDSEDDSDEGSEEGEEGLGLLSLLAPGSHLKEAKAQLNGNKAVSEVLNHTNIINGHLVDDDDEELEEVSLIPDAAQVQTPAASNDEAGSEPYRLEQLKERRTNLSIVTSSSPKPATPEPDTNEGDSDAKMDTEEDQDREAEEHVHDEMEPTEDKFEEVSDHVKEASLPTEEISTPSTPVSASKAIKTPVPGLLRATLREYQHYGLDWLAGLYAKDTNGILADEMGLGKTIQTISLLAHVAEVHGVWGPHLIVVPTSVMLNWEIEFKKFLPGFKVLVYYGTPDERKQKRKGWLDDDKWNVVITSYQLVLQDQNSFKRRGWHYMVLDEAHNIKNWKSARWQTLLGFRTSHRLLLTGTPLQNNLTELWSLMFFLMPYSEDEGGRPHFTGLEEFTAWFNKPVNQIMEQGRGELTDEARELVQRLHTILRPYILRRLKADVEKQMPAKYEHVVYCKLSKRQRHLYDGFMSRASTRETLASGNYLSIINCLMQLRKVCNHPDLFETRQIVTSYAMPKSAMADFEIKDLLLRRRLLCNDDSEQVSLDAINLLPASKGPISALDTLQSRRVGAQLKLAEMIKKHFEKVPGDMQFDGSSLESSLSFMANQAHQLAGDKLDSQWKLLKMRSQERPLTSPSTVNFIRRKLSERQFIKHEFTLPVPDGDLTVLQHYRRRDALPLPPRPTEPAAYVDWLDYSTPVMKALSPTVELRSEQMQPLIQRFGCITPAVVAHGVHELAVGKPGRRVVQEVRTEMKNKEVAKVQPFHEAQTRLSIAFPDKRLLQYDCGKLQRLDVLLRTLQSGGHRALIFTQMTKVLDILEQFLNIHGHRYLRLDGSTKVEQRQILTDRFNNDTRILAFILSSRSGGLGINLTGADTVIFYDLDWNPAMDKQCQDRCHRIGQTRDVHIYRFVSEYTIEANILRKANQKRLLDDVIIQDGDFTTEHFNQPNTRDTEEDDAMHEADAEASAAMDRVLGAGPGGDSVSTKLLAHAEDKEDILAANVAEKEGHADDADFNEQRSGTNTRADTPKAMTLLGTNFNLSSDAAALDGGDGKAEFFSGAVQPRTEAGAQIFAEKAGIGVDRYILEFLEWDLRDVPLGPPEDKKVKKKRGRKPGDYATKRRRAL